MTLTVNENKFVKWPRIYSDNKFGEEKSVWNDKIHPSIVIWGFQKTTELLTLLFPCLNCGCGWFLLKSLDC